MALLRRYRRNQTSDNETLCCVGLPGKMWTKIRHYRFSHHLCFLALFRVITVETREDF